MVASDAQGASSAACGRGRASRSRGGGKGGRRQGSGRRGVAEATDAGGEPFIAVLVGGREAAGDGTGVPGQASGEHPPPETSAVRDPPVVGLVVMSGWKVLREVRSDAPWYEAVDDQLARPRAPRVMVFWQHDIQARARLEGGGWVPGQVHRLPGAHGGHVVLTAAVREKVVARPAGGAGGVLVASLLAQWSAQYGVDPQQPVLWSVASEDARVIMGDGPLWRLAWWWPRRERMGLDRPPWGAS